jgi:hypothetical protein
MDELSMAKCPTAEFPPMADPLPKAIELLLIEKTVDCEMTGSPMTDWPCRPDIPLPSPAAEVPEIVVTDDLEMRI